MTCRHYTTLLWRNYLLKKRSPLASTLELLLPFTFVCIMSGLFFAFTTRTVVDSEFTDPSYWVEPPPVSVLPAVLLAANARLAVVARTPAAATALSAWIAHMNITHGAWNGSSVGGVGFTDPTLRSTYVPPFGDALMYFPDEGSLEAYCTRSTYGNDGQPTVWAAVVFNSGALQPGLDYTLRFNSSQVPTTELYTNIWSRGYNSRYVNQYAYGSVLIPGRGGSTSVPGFLSLQLEIDRWAINRTVPLSQLDPLTLVADMAEALSLLQPGLGALYSAEMLDLMVTDPPRYAALLDGTAAYLQTESMAPQQSRFVPFPIRGYVSNPFYAAVLPFLGLFFIASFLLPVSRLIRAIVSEKETKIREGLRMAGLGQAALFFAWMTTYCSLYALLALAASILAKLTFFPRSDFAIIFMVFWLLGVSSSTFCYLMSTFFSKAKTASTVGIVLFIAGYFPLFYLQPDSFSTAAKLGGALLSPTAFGLGLQLVGTLEDASVGATRATVADLTNNWSVGLSLFMMAFDAVLYSVLAWYFENTLPPPFREFGVARPFYFPCTPRYWRDVCGCKGSESARRTVRKAGSSTALLNPLNAANSSSSTTSAPANSATSVAAAAVRGGGVVEELDSAARAKERDGRCVSVRGLRKEFPTPDGVKLAVDDVDLTLLEGQITVLLGHNGAGKSTTISMLTGLIEPTAGDATVFGLPLSTDMSTVSQQLGVCPQHDVLWPELTVAEHLRLFAEVKGVPRDRVAAEVENIISEVGLTEKRAIRSANLSGGQKRKLSLGCALIGGSKFILLDEPTSGMDPYSRRSTWQVLQNVREGRVILLTTHFMDEADILGDRIAIMAQGRIAAAGTPMFLKEQYGVGYLLSMVMMQQGSGQADAILSLVKAHVPSAVVGTCVGAELSIRLPLDASPRFPAMLSALEGKMQALGIRSYGVTVSSVEDVFLKIASDEATTASANAAAAITGLDVSAAAANSGGKAAAVEDGGITASSGSKAVSVIAEGSGGGAGSDIARIRQRMRVEQSAFFKHFTALFRKRLQWSRRDMRSICYLLLIPAIVVTGGIGLIKLSLNLTQPDMQLSTAGFNTNPFRGVTQSQYPNYVPVFDFKSTDAGPGVAVSADIQALYAAIPAANLSTDGAALTFTPAQAAGIVDNSGFVTSNAYPLRHYQQMSAFLLDNAPSYAASKYGALMWHSSSSIIPQQSNTSVVPGSAEATYTVLHNTSSFHAAPLFANLLSSAMYKLETAARGGGSGAFITTRSHPLPYTTRQQALIDSTTGTIIGIVILVGFSFVPASWAIYVVKEREVGAKFQQLLSGVDVRAWWLSNYLFDITTFLVPAGTSIAAIFGYNIQSFVAAERNKVTALVLLFLLFGLSSAAFTYAFSFLFKSHSSAQNATLYLNIVCIILSIASVIMSQLDSTCQAERGLRAFLRLIPGFAFANGIINLSFLDLLPQLSLQCDAYSGKRPFPSDFLPWDALDTRAVGLNLIVMAVDSVMYLLVAIMLDVGGSHPRWRMWCQRDPKVEDAPVVEDEDVVAERARVAEQVRTGALDDVILLNGLRKVYKGGKVAVKDLSFGVPMGEVFGFLGINGAGKSSTLAMLSGDALPTRGTAAMAGYDILRQQPQVRRLLGYCPQHDALLELLTVREHLELFARIKGVSEARLGAVVAAGIEEMDLGSFENKLAGSLSGGNKRKLCTAIALIGRPPVLFLDEPSTGMDPLAKRFMWSVLARIASQQKECAIMLTTHSMEEVQALCSRMGIMRSGRLVALGTAQHLRSRYAQGFSCEIKLAAVPPAAVVEVENKMKRVLGANTTTVTRMGVSQMCTELAVQDREAELSETGSGWALHAQLAGTTGSSLPLRDLAQWWAEEDAVAAAVGYMLTAFPGAALVERHGSNLRFRLPPLPVPISNLFARVEEGRERYGIVSYTLGQQTLEQIFNSFAAAQEEEKGVARGMLEVTAQRQGTSAAITGSVNSGGSSSSAADAVVAVGADRAARVSSMVRNPLAGAIGSSEAEDEAGLPGAVTPAAAAAAAAVPEWRTFSPTSVSK